MNRFLRSSKNMKNDYDKGTIKLIWITIGIVNFLGVTSAIFLRASICENIIIPYAGLILIILGMILRFVSVWTLGKLFTVDITIRDEHKIIKDGVYRIIRHPSYLGAMLSFIGFGVSLNNWVSLFVISVPVLIAIINRINVEEKILIEQFKSEYLDYMKKTYRLIPWIY